MLGSAGGAATGYLPLEQHLAARRPACGTGKGDTGGRAVAAAQLVATRSRPNTWHSGSGAWLRKCSGCDSTIGEGS